MVNGVKNGSASKAVTTYMEETARRAWEAGKAVEMRNWTYAYALGQMSKIKGKFKVAPLPSWQGGGKAGILGGHNLVVSAYSKNPNGAVVLTHFLTSPKVEASQCPDCFGTGMWYPQGYEKGVARCAHDKLKAPEPTISE